MVNSEILLNTPKTDYNPTQRNPTEFAELVPGKFSAAIIHLNWVLSTQVYVDAIDLSHWNYSEGREPDYEIVKMNGFDIVIHKSTQGTWFMDNKFDIGWRSCLDNDIIPLTYHFNEDQVGGFVQAQWCLSNIAEYLKAVDGKTIIFGDHETMTSGVAQHQRQNRAKAFNETIVEEGFLSGNYSSKYLWEKLMGTVALPWVNKYFQWAANWTPATSPLKPVGWNRDDVWQYAIWPKHSWAKKVGTNGNVDVCRFYGTLEKWKDILGITPTSDPDCCEEIEAGLAEAERNLAVLSGRVTESESHIVTIENEQKSMGGIMDSIQTDIQLLQQSRSHLSTRVTITESQIAELQALVDRVRKAVRLQI